MGSLAGRLEDAVSIIAMERHEDSMIAIQGPPSGYWLHVVSHLDPKYGGLSAVVPQLCSTLAGSGEFKIGIEAFCSPGEEYAPPLGPEVSLRYWPGSRAKWMTARSLQADFRAALRSADGLHIHGLWNQSTMVAASVARSLGKPYILSAHGMLERWALDNKRVKKLIYAALIERANVDGAACLHALTGAEAEDYRRFGCRAPIAVIPNGVSIPAEATPAPFLARYSELQGKRILLFLGRLHFKKGLDLLVKAWAQLSREWPDATLVLAGPDSENTRATLERLIHASSLGRQVLLTGMLDREMKWSALAASQCFVLPSYSEGLSVSTLEAMGMGLPVIVTEQCNLPEVVHCGAGWQIQPDLKELVGAMSQFLNNSHAANQKLGKAGKDLVADRYTWPVVGAKMSEVYRWVRHGVTPKKVELQMYS